jgi:hypothetical protein
MIDSISQEFVKLGLKFGTYDKDYVDAYYGQTDLKTIAEMSSISLEQIISKSKELMESMESVDSLEEENIFFKRKTFLSKQLRALHYRARIVNGELFSFDEEARLLYDTKVPKFEENHFQSILSGLDELLPGEGDIHTRFDNYEVKFNIPKDKFESAFRITIDEARRRTNNNLELNTNENFKVKYVSNKPWKAFNWYKGNFQSLIEINTDLPLRNSDLINLASHEGYPGHHVHLSMIDEELVSKRGWNEFTLIALYSPMGFLAEGIGNFGIQVAFPNDEREIFEKETIAPMLGFDPVELDEFHEIRKYSKELQFASIEVARRFIDNQFTIEEAAKWLQNNSTSNDKSAPQLMKFIENYRSYVINYSLGEKVVEEFVNRNGGKEDLDKRWELHKYLMSTPLTAYDIQ